mmetsp:Transcript_12838/g.18478  ORF Transcript_12838/g.18478 Transcript_12838/m.18478 type:complete len:81 (+) Transcript_12838:372-614(+)
MLQTVEMLQAPRGHRDVSRKPQTLVSAAPSARNQFRVHHHTHGWMEIQHHTRILYLTPPSRIPADAMAGQGRTSSLIFLS